jgi:hypothetical protein
MRLHLGGSKVVLTMKGINKLNKSQDGNNWNDTSDFSPGGAAEDCTVEKS